MSPFRSRSSDAEEMLWQINLRTRDGCGSVFPSAVPHKLDQREQEWLDIRRLAMTSPSKSSLVPCSLDEKQPCLLLRTFPLIVSTRLQIGNNAPKD
jgi:hypothetical protein